ncbi:branched-chain amino acid transport system ATP-binding protein [Thermoflavimicrobium dichotomicum]|uniref:Branched-chain amino acid transport system ATP-binding protein n=1 Tax=Thermoflavimicrobium dichotomicum TaxID=46223 RepID=A0A1I3RYF1_9BACL|nr:branched-chain amino acid transport system ATP-binding protein [Thermoflavimicrobium dichotomicum]
MLLEIEQMETFIGQYHILHGITLSVPAGEVTVLLGRNGAGKTTTLRSIMGLAPAQKGTIRFCGEEIQAFPPYEIVRRGIGYVPEDQGIFGDLTVEENLKVAMKHKDSAAMERLQWTLELFPDLKTDWHKKGAYLSGGQKQMLSIARALVQDLSLLLIDEPSKGLAPIMVEKVAKALLHMKQKTTIVLVEQNFAMASWVGDRFYILDDGKTVAAGPMKELKEDQELKRKYLGVS